MNQIQKALEKILRLAVMLGDDGKRISRTTEIALTALRTGKLVVVDESRLYWFMMHVGCLLKYLPDCPQTNKVEEHCILKDYDTGCSTDAMFQCWKAYLKGSDNG